MMLPSQCVVAREQMGNLNFSCQCSEEDKVVFLASTEHIEREESREDDCQLREPAAAPQLHPHIITTKSAKKVSPMKVYHV